VRQSPGFGEFYEANYSRIVALVAALLGDRHEAQDVAQEAFARAFARWSRLGNYELPEAWVRKVAMRIAIDSTRRVRRAIGLSAKLTALRQQPAPGPAESLEFTPLGSALMRLPLREREVLVLRYVADLPVEDIARDCGLPSGTVKTRLATGRRHLERELAKQGAEVPNAG
jgi:RNA polymerase sigma-70 factor, ECF subfamily